MKQGQWSFRLVWLLVMALFAYAQVSDANENLQAHDKKGTGASLSPDLLKRPNHRGFNVRIMGGGTSRSKIR